MHSRKRQSACIGFLCFLLGAVAFSGWDAPVSAGPQPGDTEFIVSGGGQHDGAQIAIFGVELIPKPGRLGRTGVVGNLSLDHQMTRHWGVELDWGFTPRLGKPHAASVTTATAGLTYYVNPKDKAVLYLAAGGGSVWFHAADRGIGNDVTGMGMAAIGVKLYSSYRIMMRLDYRFYYAPSPFTDQNLLQRTTLGVGMRF